MGRNKQATCKICYKEMRSDNIKEHMKVHLKIQSENKPNEELCRELVFEVVDNVIEKCNSTNVHKVEKNELKRKLEETETDDDDNVRKVILLKTEEYKKKIALGKTVYKVLGEGEGEEEALPYNYKRALELYMKQGDGFIYKDVELKPWQRELMEQINTPSDRHIIWIVGEACGEGKTWFQKYVRSMFGIRRVVSGINIKSNSANICHCLAKQSLATADIFLFNIGKSMKRFEEVNYEVLEDLKDGDAFASKYNSQELKIKVPNVVMVFSNNEPNTQELATDRWKVFQIVNGQLEEIEVDQDRSTNLAKKNTNSKKKSIYRYNSDSDSDVC